MPSPLIPGAEGLGVRRLTIAVLACLFAAWAGVTLADSPYMVFAVLAGLLYVGTLAVNAKALAWLVIALQPAALIVPFFPGRPFWWELCALLAWPSLLVHFLVNRQKLSDLKFDRLERNALVALMGYVGVLVVLMFYRGVGFRALGGEQMGGRVYAQQIVLSVLPVLMLVASLRQNKIWWAMAVGWALTLTFLVAEFSYSFSGGVIQNILYFVELPIDGLNFEAGFTMTGIRRFCSLAAVGSAGLAFMWTLAPLRDLFGRWALIAVPAILAFLAAGLGSGYRNMLIVPVMTFFFLTIFQRFWSLGRIIAGIMGLAALLSLLYAVSAQLPLPVQRSISFLPGIDISQVARNDAATTNQDRLEVVKLAVADIPEYWVVGRGFGMDRIDRAPLDSVNAGIRLLYDQGMFYNGVLGTLVKTGVPGLFFTLLFVWYVSRMALELIRLARLHLGSAPDRFELLCLLLSATWFSIVVFFYATNGDINSWMQLFGLLGALIIACRRLQAERLVR